MNGRGSARGASPAKRLEIIRRFVADAADRPIEDVADDVDLYATLNVDSLGIAAIFIDLSHAFDIPEPAADADFAVLNTPAALAAYVVDHLSALVAAAPPVLSPSTAPRLHVAAVGGPSALLRALPYGEEMRCVDGIEMLADDHIVTTMTWQAHDPRVAAHLIGSPAIVPGVFLAEQAAQSALLLALFAGRLTPERPLVLTRLMCDFRRAAQAPCTVVAHVRANVSDLEVDFVATCRVTGRDIAQITGMARSSMKSVLR
jgi:acyl carrier protein